MYPIHINFFPVHSDEKIYQSHKNMGSGARGAMGGWL